MTASSDHCPSGNGSPSAPPPDQRLGRARRVTESRIFQEAYDQGCRCIGKYMVMWLRRGEGASLRLGVVASRKTGGAVIRFRGKRLLREVYRRNRYKCAGDCDVILIARRGLAQAAWRDIEAEFMDLARRSGILRGP